MEAVLIGVFGRRVAQVLGGRDATPQSRDDGRKIIVPEKAYKSDSPYDLVQSVVNFVNFALRKAYYNRDELAQNALRSYHVDYYMAQVNNGGHSQYAANSNMLDFTLRDCQEGLEAMRHEAASLHRRFLTFAKAEPARMDKVFKGGGFGDIDPAMDKLDKEFYELCRQKPLIEANRTWLKSLPELRVVADDEYMAVTDAFAAANKHASARKDERERQAKEDDAKDPLKQAMGYLCIMVKEPRRFIAWHQGQPGQDLGDGIKIVRFVVETDRGMCYAYFHPKWSLLFDMVAKGDPIAQVPTEMVVAHVQRSTGHNLMDVLRR